MKLTARAVASIFWLFGDESGLKLDKDGALSTNRLLLELSDKGMSEDKKLFTACEISPIMQDKLFLFKTIDGTLKDTVIPSLAMGLAEALVAIEESDKPSKTSNSEAATE